MILKIGLLELTKSIQEVVKADMVRINERIPFYKFVPKEEIPEAQYSHKEVREKLKGMKCLTSATLRRLQSKIHENFNVK